MNVILNDFDRVVPANLDTGLLNRPGDEGRFKTSVAAGWLEGLGFRPRLIERPFDADTRHHPGDPSLALCGFDGTGPRRALDGTGFAKVIECGLGGTADDFDVIDFHTLGPPSPPAAELWPPGPAAAAVSEEAVLENPVYRGVRDHWACGHMELAGVSVAVPFVGAEPQAWCWRKPPACSTTASGTSPLSCRSPTRGRVRPAECRTGTWVGLSRGPGTSRAGRPRTTPRVEPR